MLSEIAAKKHLESFFCILQALHTPYVQLVDNFAKPVMCLLGDVIQWFVENGVDYEPESIYSDVRVSIFSVTNKKFSYVFVIMKFVNMLLQIWCCFK